MLISYYTILLSYLFSKTCLVLACFPLTLKTSLVLACFPLTLKTSLVLACFPLTLKRLIVYTYIGITICPYATFRRFDAPNQIRQH